MHVFRHPKFYDELRKKRKEFQKQQKELGEKAMKDEATSDKQQATSDKHQATSVKLEASSDKRLSRTAIKIHEAWCVANGYKRQATSNELACDILTQDNLPVYKSSDYKASSVKRQAA